MICLGSPKLTGGSTIEIVGVETTLAQVYEITLTVEPLGGETKFLVKNLTPVGTTKWSECFVIFVRLQISVLNATLQISVLIATHPSSDVTSTATWEVTVNASDTVTVFFKCVRIPFGA